MAKSLTNEQAQRLLAAFRMPFPQTMMSRKSSLTNAFVNALIPVIEPTAAEIEEALEILGMDCDSIQCAYCGNTFTEWDHLRPLVKDRRPTGYISEIANLVPSCAKCNQSKGNKNWLTWMESEAQHSPARRGVPDIQRRIGRLKAYEAWRIVEPLPFKQMLGQQEYEAYWRMLDQTIEGLKTCQAVADRLKRRIAVCHRPGDAHDR
jgi:hypothetical protein